MRRYSSSGKIERRRTSSLVEARKLDSGSWLSNIHADAWTAGGDL